MSLPMPPPPHTPKPAPAPIWKRLWFWVIVVMVLGAWAGAVSIRMSIDEGVSDGGASADCLRPSRAWLDTLQSAFNRKYRRAAKDLERVANEQAEPAPLGPPPGRSVAR